MQTSRRTTTTIRHKGTAMPDSTHIPQRLNPGHLIVSMLPHPACRPGRFESRKQPARHPSRLDDMPAPLPRLVVCHTFAFFCENGCFGACLRGMAVGMQEAPIRDKLYDLVVHFSASLAQALTERPLSRE